MKFNAIFLQIVNQFKFNWLRIVISSIGVLIGVWTIASVSSIGLSAVDTIVGAINSQNQARFFQVSKVSKSSSSNNSNSFTQENIALSQNEVENIKKSSDNIKSINPNIPSQNAYFIQDKSYNCLSNYVNTLQKTTNVQSEQDSKIIDNETKLFDSKCFGTEIDYTPLQDIKILNATWYGDKNQPLKKGEVAVCFKCGKSIELYKKFNVEKPEDLLGKTISFEYIETPNMYSVGDTVNQILETTPKLFDNQTTQDYIIKAVYDDRDIETNIFSGGGATSIYGSVDDYINLTKLSGKQIPANIGYTQYTAEVESFEKLEDTLNTVKNSGYEANSNSLTLIKGIRSVFYGLIGVLSLFGIIALLASMFGIINVLTITVLRRKKEIGILKSLGARNSDIFVIFLGESALLGFIGWVLGMVATLITNTAISKIFNLYLARNSGLSKNLASFNITEFSPTIYWYIAIVTLLIALLVTMVSGFVPALRAARQNPVDVLR
jgi:ABC-type antimicrobial peptide transport system permease subunit